MMTVTEAHALAASMDLRLEEYEVGADKFYVRHVADDLWVTYVSPFAAIVEFLERMKARGPREYDPKKRDYESALGLIGQTADTPPDPILPDIGRKFDDQQGWIVWVQNNQDYWLAVSVRWWAGEQHDVRFRLSPCFGEWVPSDGHWDGYGHLRPEFLEVAW